MCEHTLSLIFEAIRRRLVKVCDEVILPNSFPIRLKIKLIIHLLNCKHNIPALLKRSVFTISKLYLVMFVIRVLEYCLLRRCLSPLADIKYVNILAFISLDVDDKSNREFLSRKRNIMCKSSRGRVFSQPILCSSLFAILSSWNVTGVANFVVIVISPLIT